MRGDIIMRSAPHTYKTKSRVFLKRVRAERRVPIVELFLLPAESAECWNSSDYVLGKRLGVRGSHYFDGKKVRVPPFGTLSGSKKSSTIGTRSDLTLTLKVDFLIKNSTFGFVCVGGGPHSTLSSKKHTMILLYTIR